MFLRIVSYLFKRSFFIVVTLFGVLVINFSFIQLLPTNSIQKIISDLNENNDNILDLGQDDISKFERQFGFNEPFYRKFFIMTKNYMKFDFGESFYKTQKVIDIIKSRAHVSMLLFVGTFIILYMLAIPLGILKSLFDKSRFDFYSTIIIYTLYSIPGFFLSILLIYFFASGQFLSFFPLGGLRSDYLMFSIWSDIKDYFMHLTLPILSIALPLVARQTMFVKNTFLEEIHKNYVIAARARGVSEVKILLNHIFPNAFLVLLNDFQSRFIRFFTSSTILIESIFSLDGLGSLTVEASLSHDTPVLFAILFLLTLAGSITHILCDFLHMTIDPRIRL
jgi:microcin C transport system permease protein